MTLNSFNRDMEQQHTHSIHVLYALCSSFNVMCSIHAYLILASYFQRIMFYLLLCGVLSLYIAYFGNGNVYHCSTSKLTQHITYLPNTYCVTCRLADSITASIPQLYTNFYSSLHYHNSIMLPPKFMNFISTQKW